MEKSNTDRLIEATRDQFEFVAKLVPERDGWKRVEWTRPGTVYYDRCEIRDQEGQPVAIHDEDGKCWILPGEINEPASPQADPVPWS